MAYKGVDISNNNGYVDMSSLKQKGYSFVISKATEGCSFKDSYYVSNIQTAKNLNLLTGAYHFAHFDTIEKAIQEANEFISMFIRARPDFLVLDTEDPELQGNLTEATDAFMNVLKQENLPILIYSSPSYFKEHFDTSVQQYCLWIADYGVNIPDLWCWNSYALWQYTDNEDGLDANIMTEEFYNLLREEDKMKDVVLYFGDGDVFSAIIVAQRHQCGLFKKSDFEALGLKADNIMTIGGIEVDRYATFKAAANLV